jgi:UDP-N-acetylglucosamine--N-acetylmuramyl-(pentapeptide) pyrophosphoryl-undecaprenol N-acetylglucosamine transferase
VNAPLVVLAAGGTGGHLFPAEALAGELLARGLRAALITDRRGRGFGERLPGVPVHRISAGAMAGTGMLGRAEGALRLALGLFQARGLIARLAPSVAVGFGGYPSVPTMLAAARAGLPTLLHEQNAVLGRANRLLARRATMVAGAFPGLALPGATPLVVTGNPVRPAIAAVGMEPYRAPGCEAPLHLLVLGGSQGARVFSRVVPEALALLPPGLRARLVLAQQCRPEDLDQVRAAYERLGIAARLASFFEDIPALLAEAHLVVARAGASTVAELAAAGRPAILVPYPFAADDHQTANAESAGKAGGAWPVAERSLTAAALAERLAALAAEPAVLAAAAEAAGRTARRDAAERLADLVLDLLPQNGRAGSGQRRERAA